MKAVAVRSGPSPGQAFRASGLFQLCRSPRRQPRGLLRDAVQRFGHQVSAEKRDHIAARLACGGPCGAGDRIQQVWQPDGIGVGRRVTVLVGSRALLTGTLSRRSCGE